MTAMDSAAQAPSLARRMAAFLYEGVLLFGVVFFAGFVYSVITGQRHGLQGRLGLSAFLFIVLGLYFVAFWSRGGQTLALKTWHLRVVTHNGQPLGQGRALMRYVLAYLWFLPALTSVWVFDLHGGGVIAACLLAGIAVYAGLARLHPQGLFLHEALSGSRVVTHLPIKR